jgi:hypothetical protein
MYCCRQGACEKLTLPARPNSQKPMFRTQWQRFSISLARLPARPENPFAFNVAPGFSPASVPATECSPCLCHPLLKPLCRRRAVCAPDYSAGESAFHRNSGLVKSTKPKLCKMSTSGIEQLKPFTISTSKTNNLKPPEMNTCEKRGVGYPVGFVILLGCKSFRSGGGTA